MTVHAEKTGPSSENRTQTSPETARGAEEVLGIPDQRPEQAVQRKLQQLADQSVAPVQKKENTTGLPDNLKAGIEHLSGYAMDDVKVHYNSGKPAELQAHAYAQGSDIHVAPGQEKHLPHEAWHVVQQKQKRVAQTFRYNGVGINDDRSLENEADVMGARALQGGPVSGEPAQLKEAEADGPAQLILDSLAALAASALTIETAAALAFAGWALSTVGMVGLAWFTVSKIRQLYQQYQAANAAKATASPAATPAAAAASSSSTPSGSATLSAGSAAKAPKWREEWDAKKSKFKIVRIGDSFTKEEEEGFRAAAAETNLKNQLAANAAATATPVSSPSAGAGAKPKRSKKVSAAKKFHDENVKNKQAAAAAASAGSEPVATHREVLLTGEGSFHVNLFKRGEGTKSKGLHGAGASKPLAIVYGYYEDTDGDETPAEVHVHFNDGNPINSHTGAHVKFEDETYGKNWPAGNASASADLKSILDIGMGDSWKSPATYR